MSWLIGDPRRAGRAYAPPHDASSHPRRRRRPGTRRSLANAALEPVARQALQPPPRRRNQETESQHVGQHARGEQERAPHQYGQPIQQRPPGQPPLRQLPLDGQKSPQPLLAGQRRARHTGRDDQRHRGHRPDPLPDAQQYDQFQHRNGHKDEDQPAQQVPGSFRRAGGRREAPGVHYGHPRPRCCPHPTNTPGPSCNVYSSSTVGCPEYRSGNRPHRPAGRQPQCNRHISARVSGSRPPSGPSSSRSTIPPSWSGSAPAPTPTVSATSPCASPSTSASATGWTARSTTPTRRATSSPTSASTWWARSSTTRT